MIQTHCIHLTEKVPRKSSQAKYQGMVKNDNYYLPKPQQTTTSSSKMRSLRDCSEDILNKCLTHFISSSLSRKELLLHSRNANFYISKNCCSHERANTYRLHNSSPSSTDFFFFTSVGKSKSVLPLLQPVCHTEYYAIHEMGVLASNYLLLASLHMYRSLDKYTPSSS